MKNLTQKRLNDYANKWTKTEYISKFMHKYIRDLKKEHRAVISALMLKNMQSKFEYTGINELFNFIKEIECEYIKN